MSFGKITTCLWFQDQAEEAAKYYTSIFAPNSKITTTPRHTPPGQEAARVMIVEFELQGRTFVALNGGPAPWQFNEAVSFMIDCKDQAEVDHFWEKLSENGDVSRQQCGWLADKYGVAWQVVPTALKSMMGSEDKAAAGRATEAMMKMKKLDIAELEKAFKG
ncbi:Glyoxalase/Bleomycin resistance protein/Dihydroxybiphenyl dioxygenase [Fusarium flagelliforme]|uniref:Glyoxalase/Bleomycin resistance protein/Dihydroxybiphenyl dioxygenase n=1 Tax=Fusarium flagelliforme TaxID=2675880 RepID=UPI001E8E4CD1|nr:Glyoxalase/Bleomycin resistance protein/Dihydroxybiphenyl dioxygenase [Fusarium flagelliforme]KAH7193722.1 Glyoxalase/Bleomycin resistance protein/Dihydroxybiphenyl dioxygenase [Fusarium flagelliforme]